MNSRVAKSVYELLAQADSALSGGDINTALRMVHNFVENIISQPLCTALVFASKDLDQLCQRIGSKNLTLSDQSQYHTWTQTSERQRIIYVVTRLQKSGGHSRLVWDFIKAQPDKDHIILATGLAGPSDIGGMADIIEASENIRFLAAPRGNLQSRLSWLQGALKYAAPEHVYLFNNHQDSVAVASMVPELGLKASFCHHGDHHLCLGVHLENVVHLDHHPMGYHHCREELGIDNVYLPLTFEDHGLQTAEKAIDSYNGITTATVARSNKIEIPYFISYIDIVPQIVQATRGRHIHIGKLTPWALQKIKSGFRKAGIAENRFIYIEYTPSVWKTLQEQQIDAYIASFPYGAGLTLIETMGAGIPVILHRHLWSRILSGLELAYPEAFSWRNPKDLLDYLSVIDIQKLRIEGNIARKQYEKFHLPDLLKNYLNNSESYKYNPSPMKLISDLRQDEWAASVSSQMRFSALGYNLIYRLFRRLRAFLSWGFYR